ncbi:complement C1q-like protein 4 isoform X1 [Dreissena polymorpha]|uniref:C1q domain-containing protein n=1 Tax=Dreissena polymorpha TaxID=45954 RepID=A0A9D4BVV1_DREPO|nr:complement C1q-like protein 4 isoform X1 [Dreissena polymorpha]KAH3711259.1 hypothetical protein DPMN_070761 [Dreissena polymorpha]
MKQMMLLSALLFVVAEDATAELRDISFEERMQAIIRNETELMRQELEKMNDIMHETRHELEMLRQENALLHEMCKATTNENELRVKRQHVQSVAFHAYQSGNKCIQNMQTFVYEQVLLNDGNGYSTRDGIFDPPVSGVYVFTWSIADHHDWYAAELVVDGVSRGATIADNDTDDTAVGTAVVVLYVRAGSHVFVRRSAGNGCTVLNEDNLARNSFSGWLLYP